MRAIEKMIAVALAGVVSGLPAGAETIRSGAGSAAADIQSALDQFRADLGALNPNNPGSLGSGRREINWDGVPDTVASPNPMAGDFFNGATPGRARGAVFTTPGTAFEISADNDNPTLTPGDFANINPAYSTDFAAFTPQRLFTAVGSNIVDVTFRVPGEDTPALVRGFGSVFSDVDLHGSASLSFYDKSGGLLNETIVPAAGLGDGTFSFLGVAFDDAIVARVRITSGTDALSPTTFDAPSAASPVDLVVMDDFVFGEPVAVPEPASAALLGLGLLARRRRG